MSRYSGKIIHCLFLLALLIPGSVPAGEISRDGRFIAYDNGTVLDTRTNLMWATKDNGRDIDWKSARAFCDNYRGGGYTNWRMPTLDELAGLYDASKSHPVSCHYDRNIHSATELIEISCFVPWASESSGSDAAFFNFYNGERYWDPQSYERNSRALPVRSIKPEVHADLKSQPERSSAVETEKDEKNTYRFVDNDNSKSKQLPIVNEQPSLTAERKAEGLAATNKETRVVASPLRTARGYSYASSVTDYYTIRIGAFKSKANAVGLTRKLRAKGYDVYLKTETGEGAVAWYKVYVGRYGTQANAKTAAAKLSKNKMVSTGLVVIKIGLPLREDRAQPGFIEQDKQQAARKTEGKPAIAPVVAEVKKEEIQTNAEISPHKEEKDVPQEPRSSPAYSLLEEGLRQYKDDNFEEAIDILSKARQEDRSSSETAFFLGMAFKQTNDYQNALINFQDAATLKPPIQQAVVEIIDALVQMERLDDTWNWIAIAEKHHILPAKTAFLKGMVLAKKGQYAAAVASFENSKKLEKSYTQAADFQIALAYVAERKYAKARDRLQAAVTQDPLSDLASFARRYQDIVEEQSFLQRPIRMTLGITGMYDTNMLQEPITYPGLPDSGTEQTLAVNTSLRLDYVPILPGQWLFNAGYGAVSRLNERNSTRYDLFANTFSAAPGYDFGRFALNLSGNYTFVMKRGDYENNGGGYRRYSENFSVGPLFRFLADNDHIFELYAGYAKKNYFKTTPVGNPQDNMSAGGLDSYVSWMWMFKNGGLLNTRFLFNVDNADGIYWDSRSYKLTANFIYPLPFVKKVNLQLGGEYNIVPYIYENQYFGNNVRLDNIYSGIVGINWIINRNINALIQYTGTRANSNIYIYDYSRSLWSVGVEMRY